MDKKFYLFIGLAVAWIGGEVWVNVAPAFATLVVALELVAGCFLGYFYKKFKDEEEFAKLNEELTKVKNELYDANVTINELRKTKKSTVKVVKTPTEGSTTQESK